MPNDVNDGLDRSSVCSRNSLASQIHMRNLLVLIFVLLTTVGTPLQAADNLHRRQVKQVNPGGKDLVMSFEEVRRDEKTSLAKVTFVSGASGPASMFVVRGFYDIAKARGATHFIKLKEWRGPDDSWMYLVGFSNTEDIVPKEYFKLAESVEPKFMAVSDFDPLFKENK